MPDNAPMIQGPGEWSGHQ